MHGVAEEGQADGLRANATGGIEDAIRSLAEDVLDDAIERRGLALQRRRPVREEQVVIRRHLVVETLHIVTHDVMICAESIQKRLSLNRTVGNAIIAA